MGEKKDLYVRFDWAIKRLLRQKANFGVLEGFLTVFLGERIRIVEILESESNQEGPDEKYNRVDIKALDSKGEIVIIEVQNTRELNFMERLLFGTSKAVTEHIDRGQKYSNVKKVYSISIVYFNIGEGSDYLYHGQTRFIGVHTHDELLMHEKDRDALVPISLKYKISTTLTNNLLERCQHFTTVPNYGTINYNNQREWQSEYPKR